MKISIGKVKELLDSGKTVRVKTRNNEFVPITKFVEKGILETFSVSLENGNSIKVSREHKFFTNAGWVEFKDLREEIHSIFCEDDLYSKIKNISPIGKHRIVDITVDSEDHSYFGNGMLNHNSGKSLIAAHLLAETQRKGGVAVLIDTENAVNEEFFTSLGLDMSKLVYSPVSTVEEIFAVIEKIIETVRKSSKDRLVTIVVDSVAGASTEQEMASDYGKDGYATGKAIIIGKAMRKITTMLGKQKVLLVFTNQLRQKLNAMAFTDPWCVDPITTKIKIRYDSDSEFGQLIKGKYEN